MNRGIKGGEGWIERGEVMKEGIYKGDRKL